MRKLILKNHQSPGDIVMLTGAVRDLHRANPGQFATDVRTPCKQLWENNPYLTPLQESDADVEAVDCGYPLIHQSNQLPRHFIEGFADDLAKKLRVQVPVSKFQGDIHLSTREKSWYSRIREIFGADIPFWIINAGGKTDFTIKWWDTNRYQAVVDHFQGRILFVQIGESKHVHKPLKNVINLIGKTDLRQLVRLVYHSDGVLCPVTMVMHLAAAIEVKGEPHRKRPCVVVAGGREPHQWEAYPTHQFIHTVGMLSCCAQGGCWKSRTKPVGDGDQKDGNLCVDVVGDLPRCMDMITAEDVIRRIEQYYDGGMIRYLSRSEWKQCKSQFLVPTKQVND